MKEKMLKVIFAIFLFAAMSHVTFAADPSYNETYCRSCHGNTVDRHHLLLVNGTHQCTDCHATKYDSQNHTYYQEVIRNCVTCHATTAHSCVSCHLEVNSSDLGSHSTLNDLPLQVISYGKRGGE
jgi:thioredoxin-related protein